MPTPNNPVVIPLNAVVRSEVGIRVPEDFVDGAEDEVVVAFDLVVEPVDGVVSAEDGIAEGEFLVGLGGGFEDLVEVLEGVGVEGLGGEG